MKPPERIYLQWYGDEADASECRDIDLDSNATGTNMEVSWCADKIFDHDVSYVRSDVSAKEAVQFAADKNETANAFMEQARKLGNERHEALKLLGYDESERDLLKNIRRLKAYYEGELKQAKEGNEKLASYCAKLQEKVDPQDAIAIGLRELLKK